MATPLDGPLGKIERANDHLVDLQAEIEQFLARKPYGLFAETDPKTGEDVVRIRVREQPPARIAAIVGDLAHNLRSAWDYLAQQLVVANGGTPGTWTEYPIFWDAEEYKAKAGRKVRGMSDEAVDLIKRMQPYNGRAPTRDALYVIHKLDNRDKHVDWTIVGCALRGFSLSRTRQGTGPFTVTLDSFSIGKPQLVSPLEDGAELWRIKFGARTNVDVDEEATFVVAFDKAGAGDGQPVIPVCMELIDFTERGVKIFAPLL